MASFRTEKENTQKELGTQCCQKLRKYILKKLRYLTTRVLDSQYLLDVDKNFKFVFG